MAYGNFAYCYDDLNQDADYDSLAAEVLAMLHGECIETGLLADLGCGTGELTIRLAKAGYEMIGIDCSTEMLSVFREKLEYGEPGQPSTNEILLLCQDLSELDLYGTVQGAVSSFDTFNHMNTKQLESLFQRLALFIEPDGLFVFDVNSPYKHKEILANHAFKVEGKNGLQCIWQNNYNEQKQATLIQLEGRQQGKNIFYEEFLEYSYPLSFWQQLLDINGFTVLDVRDGDCFCALEDTTQRYLITAQNKSPQEIL